MLRLASAVRVVFDAATTKVIGCPDCAADQQELEREDGEQDDGEDDFADGDAVVLAVQFQLNRGGVAAVIALPVVLLPAVFPVTAALAALVPILLPVTLELGLPFGFPLFALGLEGGGFVVFVGAGGGVFLGRADGLGQCDGRAGRCGLGPLGRRVLLDPGL
mgnify:CR=1 FL=1